MAPPEAADKEVTVLLYATYFQQISGETLTSLCLNALSHSALDDVAGWV